MPSAIRLTLDPAAEPALEEVLAGLSVSGSVEAGRLSVWVSGDELEEAEAALRQQGAVEFEQPRPHRLGHPGIDAVRDDEVEPA